MVARLFVIHLDIFGHMFYIFFNELSNINIKTIFLLFHTCKRLGDIFDTPSMNSFSVNF